MSEIVVCASGYFDPLHVGHIEYLKQAKKLGNKLIVILNTDDQAKAKKGYSFMPFQERKIILQSLWFVDAVVGCVDEDGSVCKTLAGLRPNIFAKGGDRYSFEIPEKSICDNYGIEIVDGLGAKIQSSSELVENARN